MDESNFESALGQADEVMERVIDVFSMEDTEEAKFELQQLSEEIARGEHGMLARVLAPNYVGLYGQMTKVREQIARRRAELNVIIAGAATPDQMANAAVWYLRAVAMLEKIDATSRAQLQEVVFESWRPVDEQAVATLEKTAEIVVTLREAAALARCDFSIASDARRAVPVYLAGMREAAHLLQAGAIRLWQNDQPAPAAERLAICYRMSAHLASSGSLVGALLSQEIFKDTDELARQALEWDTFSTPQRAVLLAAAESMPPKDPFGYTQALADARQRIRRWLAGTFHGDAEALERSTASIHRLDGDQLLYLLVVVTHRASEDEPTPQRLHALDDCVSLESLFVAQGDSERVTERIIATGDLAAVLANPVPEIGLVEEHFSAARADYRRAIATLQPEPTPPGQ